MLLSDPDNALDSVQLDRDGADALDALDFCPGTLTGGLDVNEAGYPTRFDRLAGLGFDDALHRRWYDRFWTGFCEGFGLFEICKEDGTSWHLTVANTIARLPDRDRARARAELWALGRMIGYEWAKRNRIRKISTADLQSWRGVIESPGDP